MAELKDTYGSQWVEPSEENGKRLMQHLKEGKRMIVFGIDGTIGQLQMDLGGTVLHGKGDGYWHTVSLLQLDRHPWIEPMPKRDAIVDDGKTQGKVL